MQAQAALARTLGSCTSTSVCTSELQQWLLQPEMLGWLMGLLKCPVAEEEAAGNVALCLGNLAAQLASEGPERGLQELCQIGAVKALVGKHCAVVCHRLMRVPGASYTTTVCMLYMHSVDNLAGMGLRSWWQSCAAFNGRLPLDTITYIPTGRRSFPMECSWQN